ncbi:MAG TPA: shikimate dehydrogenase [Allosphingosinicella sp.]|nr:shikimate dehydrogenase [Allosphingosinicella sp.]
MARPFAEVIGDPIEHSKSPSIHRFWLEKTGLDAEYRRTRVAAGALAEHLAERRSDPNWRGCNLTMPHKRSVLPLLAAPEPQVACIGAANLVIPAGDGALAGHNSDAAGFLEPLRPLLARAHLFRMARIFGAGGAARAVVEALRGEGFALVVAARRPEQAARLVEGLDPQFNHSVALDYFADPTDFAYDDRAGILDLVVNTTPLGMSGRSALPIDFSHVPPGAIVYDIVYEPVETPLLREARARGHRAIDGLGMLIGQAAVAFEHFFGVPAPRRHDAELRQVLTR